MDTKRLSACSFPLKEKDLDYALSVITESGFDKVDLVARMPHFSMTDPDYSIDALEQLCEKYGVLVANLGTYCGREFPAASQSANQALADDLNATLKTAARLGARTIRVVPGDGKRSSIDSLVPFFKQAAETAESVSIPMGIENHGTEISGNAEACLEICEKVDSPYFGILYDPSNLMGGKADYQEAFEVFKDHIIHIHIKDGLYTSEGKWERTMIGQGQIDLTWIVNQIEALDYTSEYALEYEVNNIEAPETGLQKWWKYWRDL